MMDSNGVMLLVGVVTFCAVFYVFYPRNGITVTARDQHWIFEWLPTRNVNSYQYRIRDTTTNTVVAQGETNKPVLRCPFYGSPSKTNSLDLFGRDVESSQVSTPNFLATHRYEMDLVTRGSNNDNTAILPLPSFPLYDAALKRVTAGPGSGQIRVEMSGSCAVLRGSAKSINGDGPAVVFDRNTSTASGATPGQRYAVSITAITPTGLVDLSPAVVEVQ